MFKLITRSHAASIALLLPLAAGCASKSQSLSDPPAPAANESQELAVSGDDANHAETDTGSLSQAFVGGSGEALSVQSFGGDRLGGELGPANVPVSPASSAFQPAGCVSESADSASKTVTYTFNDCTGPLGLVHVSGVVTVVWSSPAPSELLLAFSSTNLHINKASVTKWDATADITAHNSDRQMIWKGSVAGTTGSGRAFNRTNDRVYTWTEGKPCLTVNGKSQGNITGKNLETDITSFSVCQDSCPAAGSDIVVKNVDTGKQIELKYDGGPHATFTAVDGSKYTFPLACGL